MTASVVDPASITAPTWASAVWGSLSPLPVRTQTIVASGSTPSRPSPTSRRIPATPAADDGSQKTPFEPGQVAIGGQDLVVGDRLDPATGFVAGCRRLRPAGRVADPDRGGDRLGLGDRVTEHDRRRTGRLEAVHPGQPRAEPGSVVVAETGPVGADVAGVADRDREDVGRPAEVVADLERGRLLAGQAVRVDRVHERDRVVVAGGQLAHDPERRVEVAVDRDDPGPGDERLEELAHRDLAARQDDDDLEPGRRAVGRRRGRRVAGRGTGDRARAELQRPAHRDDHPAVLEAPGRVRALDLEEEVREPELGTEPPGVDERRRALAEGDRRRRVGDREEPPVALDKGRSAGHRRGHASTG